jgi:hypothetical protein
MIRSVMPHTGCQQKAVIWSLHQAIVSPLARILHPPFQRTCPLTLGKTAHYRAFLSSCSSHYTCNRIFGHMPLLISMSETIIKGSDTSRRRWTVVSPFKTNYGPAKLCSHIHTTIESAIITVAFHPPSLLGSTTMMITCNLVWYSQHQWTKRSPGAGQCRLTGRQDCK